MHLKVADLDRALAFYVGVLGFEVMARMGDQAAFISAGGYHHHIGLNTWESRGGSPPPPVLRGCTTPRFATRPAPRWPTRCVAPRGRDPPRRCLGSRRQRGALSAGSRPERRRALLRPAEVRVAKTADGELTMFTAPLDSVAACRSSGRDPTSTRLPEGRREHSHPPQPKPAVLSLSPVIPSLVSPPRIRARTGRRRG